MKKPLKLLAACILSASAITAQAQAVSPGVMHEQQWVQALEIAEVEPRVEALEKVLESATVTIQETSDKAGLLIVKGNVNLEIAAALNSMKSISYLKDGKKLLEEAIKLEPMAMDGMAEASLAAATYWAPGWPIAYGSKKNALKMFEQALSDNPDSVEILTQYGHIMKDGEKDHTRARELYEAALENLHTLEDRQVLRQTREAELKASIDQLS
ncbi:MAG: hypothetical protein ACR2PT_20860 [Endozoicomonas sp.]